MFKYLLVYALAAVLLIQEVDLSSAGHSPFHPHHTRSAHRRHPSHQLSSLKHRHLERMHSRNISVKRQSETLQQLQTEVSTFSSWTTVWFASANATDPSSFTHVKGEIELHQATVQKWIDDIGTLYNTQQLQLEQAAFKGWMDEWYALGTATAWTSAVAVLNQDIQAYLGWLNAWLATADFGIPIASPTAAVQTSTTSEDYTSATPPPTSILASTPVLTATIIQSAGPQTSNSVSAFNPKAADNVAVYFGQSDKTSLVPLKEICANENVDIIIVAFVNEFFDANGTGYPTVNFGAAGGWYTNPTMAKMGATGLLQADELASNISTCQTGGKIVLLSLGGAIGSSIFSSDAQAVTFAQTLWNLFGAGNGTDPRLRPFGSVVIDGFDIDNESHNPTGYTALTTALRTQFAKDSSRKYYISAAPQCPRPDASIPLDAMVQMDFVWVQFYNNPPCNLATAGFLPSAQAWFNDLNNGSKPMMYVAAEADTADGSGYHPIETLQGEIKKVKTLNMSSFGGVALWDGSQSIANNNFQDGVKKALKGLGS